MIRMLQVAGIAHLVLVADVKKEDLRRAAATLDAIGPGNPMQCAYEKQCGAAGQAGTPLASTYTSASRGTT